jgi:predicted ArsR family transcriptional regulator
MTRPGVDRELEALAALADPTRRALYLHVVRAANEVGRDEAAAATGISRSLAAFHLDRLVEDGLLEAGYRRLSGRSGPGAGRPAKVYRPKRPVAVHIPEREYRLAAELMIEGARRSGAAERHLSDAARERGRELGLQARRGIGGRKARRALTAAATDLLQRQGFHPWSDETGTVRLRNCPFDALATEYPETMCEVNLSLLNGLLDGLGAGHLAATRVPRDGGCCVAVRPRPR